MLRQRLWMGWLVGLLCAAGCGGTEPAPTAEFDEASATSIEELSTLSRSYVTVRRDLRRCRAPLCGGYWIRDVNHHCSMERYVSALNFERARLSDEEVQKLSSAGDFELLLLGRLSLPEPEFHTRTFLVSEAWRGLPGAKPASGDAYFRMEHRTPERVCITAPCPNELAHVLNSSTVLEVSGFELNAEALPPGVDAAWLEQELRKERAAVIGRIVDGPTYPGGVEKRLSATQVFVRFPLSRPPCGIWKPLTCAVTGEKVAYLRAGDLCLYPVACVDPGSCEQKAPSCAEGYTLAEWPTEPRGCPQYACDPSFVAK